MDIRILFVIGGLIAAALATPLLNEMQNYDDDRWLRTGIDATASSSLGSQFSPDKTIDGKDNPNSKWASANYLGSDTVVVLTYDLRYVYNVYKTELISDGPGDNVRQYEVYVSEDGTGFLKVVSSDILKDITEYDKRSFSAVQARYIVVVINSWYGNHPEIREFKIFTTSTNVYLPPKEIKSVTASSVLNDTFTADKAVDDRLNTYWAGKENYPPPYSLVFDLGSIYTVNKTSINTNPAHSGIKTYDVLASQDGYQYFKIASSKELPQGKPSDFLTFEPVKVRYLKLSITSWYGSHPELAEFNIFKVTSAGVPSNAYQVFYDDCGNPKKQPHLIRGKIFSGWKDIDPQNLPSENDCVYDPLGEKVEFKYTGLDRNADYWAEVTYVQDKEDNRRQRLDAGQYEVHPDMDLPKFKAKRYTYKIPSDAYADGNLTLTFTKVSGPNPIVSEVWIYKAIQTKISRETIDLKKLPYAKALYSPSGIKVDGDLSDWYGVNPVVPYGYAELSSPVRIYTQWDEKYFYIAVRSMMGAPVVEDPKTFWLNSDAVEFFIDSKNTKITATDTSYATWQHDFWFCPTSGGSSGSLVYAGRMHHFGDGLSASLEDFSKSAEPYAQELLAESKLLPDGYVMEIALPAEKVLKGFSPAKNSYIGFNYVVYSSRYLDKLFWSVDGNPQAKSDPTPDYWGNLQLVGTPEAGIKITEPNYEVPLKTFLAGDTVYIRLEDIDANSNPDTYDFCAVQVSGIILKDNVILNLKETEKNTGVFTGQVKTKYSFISAENDFLDVQGGEILKVTYVDPFYALNRNDVPVSDTAVAGIGTTADFSISANYFNAGDTITVTLKDADLIISDTFASAVISVSGNKIKDSLGIELRETATGSGMLTGILKTRFSAKPINDDVLDCIGGEKILFTYNDALQSTGESNVKISVSGLTMSGYTAAVAFSRNDLLKPQREFLAGDTIYVKIEDADLNADKSSQQSAEGTLISLLTGDYLKITLREVGINSPIFAAGIPTRFSRTPTKDGVLDCIGGDSVAFTYIDELQEDGQTYVSLKDNCTSKTGFNATMNVYKSDMATRIKNFNAGDSLYVVVTDLDNNSDFSSYDYINLMVEGGLVNDRVALALKESEVNSGIFHGFINTKFGAVLYPNNFLEVRGNETVAIKYLDGLTSTGERNAFVSDTVYVNTGATGRILAKETLTVGEVLEITVVDADLNRYKTEQETATVTVSGNINVDTEILTLNESITDLNVFSGSLPTAFGKESKPYDGKLQITGGEIIHAVYLDFIQTDGNTNVNNIFKVMVRKGATGQLYVVAEDYTQKLDGFTAGSNLYLRVEDNDMNSDATQADTAVVIAQSSKTLDRTEIVLREVGVNSGLFFGNAKTKYSSEPVPNNGILEMQGRETVICSYLDSIQATGQTNITVADSILVRSGYTASIAATDSLFTKKVFVLNSNEEMGIVIDDADLNADPSAVNYAEAIVKGNTNGDLARVKLTEKGTNSGVFLGKVKMKYGNAILTNDELEVCGGEIVTASYRDAIDSSGRTNELLTDTLTINTGNDGKLTVTTADFMTETDNLFPDEALSLKLSDADLKGAGYCELNLNYNSSAFRTALKENPANSGVFLGQFKISSDTAVLDTSVLSTNGGKYLTVSYSDSIASSGQTNLLREKTVYVKKKYFITRTQNPIVIDGNLAEWQTGNPIVLDGYDSSGTGSKLYLLWDEDNLYVAGEIRDDNISVVNPRVFWEKSDCLELFINTSHGEKLRDYLTGMVNKGSHLFWFCPRGGGVDGFQPYAGQWHREGDGIIETIYDFVEIEIKSKAMPNGYNLEIKLPKERVLKGYSPKPGARIGFNFILDDAQRESVLWSGDANLLKKKTDLSDYGMIELK